MNQKLLVVDDDPITGRLLTEIGCSEDFETHAVEGGGAFLRKLDEFKPTAVVIDILLPDQDGITLLRHLSFRQNRPAIILISGYAHSYLPAARRLADAYGLAVIAALSKPLDISALKAALRRSPPH